jgi:peptidoglycan/xylan/chitin deacetylase (PgdA/CDA1 family)
MKHVNLPRADSAHERCLRNHAIGWTIDRMATSCRPLIVAYHAVSSSWRSPLAITESALRSQLGYLHRSGYVGLTFADAERRTRDGTLPRRSVVVTFDDGYASNLLAAPILAEFGYPGTVFVVTGFTDSGAALSWYGIEDEQNSAAAELRPLTWGELADLRDDGWEVGSHTVTHPLLPGLSGQELREQLERSRASIADHLGGCETLAYPYGVADARVADAARAAGYLAACVLTGAHFTDEPYRRPRVGLGAADTGGRLRLKVSGVGLGFRRSPVALAIRRARRRRSWQPQTPGR